MEFIVSFQCEHVISRRLNTLHIFTHYRGRDIVNLMHKLATFCSKHINWVAKVRKKFLDKNGIAVEYFANDLAEGCEPLNPLGLLSLARNWHVHICVFLKNRIWTTRKDNSLTGVVVYLAFTGDNSFVDTVPGTAVKSEKQLMGQDVFNLFSEVSTKKTENILDLSTKDSESTKKSSEVSTKETENILDLSTKGSKSTKQSSEISTKKRKSTKQTSEVSTKKRKETKPKAKESTKENKGGTKRKNSSSLSSGSKKLRSGSSNPYLKPRLSSNRSTKRSKRPLLKISLDDLLSKNKKKTRTAKPKNLKEKDPILKAFQDINNKDELEILLAPNDDEKPKKSTFPKEEIETKEGVMTVETVGCPKREKKVVELKCSVEDCDHTENSKGKLNLHQKQVHPDLTYSCSHCQATNFSSQEAAFKHEQRHFKFMHICTECPKDFQYPNQLKKHMSIHFPIKGYPCTWRGCKKVLSSKDAKNQHVLRHQDAKLKCEHCGNDSEATYTTLMSLKQHVQGSHGNGYIAYCGKVSRWPTERRKHQKECGQCGELRLKKLNKPDNPRNPKPKKGKRNSL